MAGWKEKWRDMSRFRQGLLAVMAVMIVGFALANALFCLRPGLSYRDTLLYPEHTAQARRYVGRIDGQQAVLTIRPDKTVEYQWGPYQYGPYQVIEDDSAAQKDNWGYGIEIRREDTVLFRGKYYNDPAVPFQILDGNGGPALKTEFGVSGGTGSRYYIDGEPVSEREWREPSLSVIARWALEPERLTHRGGLGNYLLVTLIALLNIAQICCPGAFFRLSLWGHVRNPERAEPSDFYMAMERIEWVVLAVMCLVLYGMTLMLIR